MGCVSPPASVLTGEQHNLETWGLCPAQALTHSLTLEEIPLPTSDFSVLFVNWKWKVGRVGKKVIGLLRILAVEEKQEH